MRYARTRGIALAGYIWGWVSDTFPVLMGDHGRRASYWTRWPDEVEGPLWAGLHLDERAGVRAIVGVELFSEPPADARGTLGPSAGESTADLLPHPPRALRAIDIEALGLMDLLERFRATGGEAAAMAGPRGSRGRRYTDAHWAAVARCVRETRGAGNHRTAQAVAGRWNVSLPTAKKWIGRCRRKGLLPAV